MISEYITKLNQSIDLLKKNQFHIQNLSDALAVALKNRNNIFLIGNGGSAGNANHIANDFLYGAGVSNNNIGLNVESLAANPSVISCLANDCGYENVFSLQLKSKAKKNDILISLSGSGNSPNILSAIKCAKEIEMNDFAILGFDGGEAKKCSKHPIHFPINDMQLAEDLQLIVLHICMQSLSQMKVI
jgi:D-sedoheptulose 7-phosphate isomerase